MIEKHLMNPRGVLGRVGDSVDCAQRSGVQGSELLARAHLGADELSGLSGAAQLRRCQPTRREFAQKSYELFLKEWKEKRTRTRELQRDDGRRETM